MEKKVVAVVGEGPITQHSAVAIKILGHPEKLKGLVHQVGTEVIKGSGTGGTIFPRFLYLRFCSGQSEIQNQPVCPAFRLLIISFTVKKSPSHLRF